VPSHFGGVAGFQNVLHSLSWGATLEFLVGHLLHEVPRDQVGPPAPVVVGIGSHGNCVKGKALAEDGLNDLGVLALDLPIRVVNGVDVFKKISARAVDTPNELKHPQRFLEEFCARVSEPFGCVRCAQKPLIGETDDNQVGLRHVLHVLACNFLDVLRQEGVALGKRLNCSGRIADSTFRRSSATARVLASFSQA
jgi:hypothetical protein